MTQGDIHNTQKSVQRLKNQIKTSADISQCEKKLLIEGNSSFPSFLTYMQNKDHSNSWIIRYLRTAKKLTEYTSWQLEDVSKTKITELIGDLNTNQLTKNNSEPSIADCPLMQKPIIQTVRVAFS